jgi:hypothetical protein
MAILTYNLNKRCFMSNILVPDDVKEDKEATETKCEYKPTEEDEERFFLMYHMNFQPSEVEGLEPNYRKWLIMRFLGQKHAEQEAMQRHQLMQQIGPNLKTKL